MSHPCTGGSSAAAAPDVIPQQLLRPAALADPSVLPCHTPPPPVSFLPLLTARRRRSSCSLSSSPAEAHV